MKTQESDYPIDFVITWVDDQDLSWQAEYNKYAKGTGDKRSIRFRDMDTLQYLFRGIEKFTPWVNKIYFVTCGQTPKWLNINHPKLVCVNHEDYIPQKYLPTFSANTIELNFHRIKGLAEHFVCFNDDTFLVNPSAKDVFFRRGLPCASAVLDLSATCENPPFLTPYANASVLNRNFKKQEVLKKYFRKFYTLKNRKYLFRNFQFAFERYFPGLRADHLPTSLLKSTYQEVWEKEYGLLDAVCMQKFRGSADVNQWLIEDWQICTGNFVPRDVNVGYKGELNSYEHLRETVDKITKGKYKMICANDEGFEDFSLLKRELDHALNKILPEKSHFEL